MADVVLAYEKLFDFVNRTFRMIGFNADDADIATTVLLSADLRGVDSHGVARLSGYLRLYEAGRINARPRFVVEHETPSTALVDADAAVGLVAAPYAMKIAIDKARRAGTGWVCVKNSNHFGIAGYHAMLALHHDMIGIAMTNASALVAPTFSVDKMLGTNPIAVAVPAKEEPPFVADFATTTASNGKLELLQRKGEPAPYGWVQDSEGNPSTNARQLYDGGSMLPLGSDREHGSHKGYALGSIVDIFSAVLSGASYAPFAPPFPAYIPMPPVMYGQGLGHFFGAIRIDAFRPAAEFKHHMDNWMKHFRKARTIKGYDKVLIPGDPERETETERRKHGIPLPEKLYIELRELGKKFSISIDEGRQVL